MRIRSVSWAPLAFTIVGLQSILAMPSPERNDLLVRNPHPKPAYEWRAMGDSYAAGIGAGEHQALSQQCYRYTEAYSVQMNLSPAGRLPGNPGQRLLTFVACTGAKTQDVLDLQFQDKVSSLFCRFCSQGYTYSLTNPDRTQDPQQALGNQK